MDLFYLTLFFVFLNLVFAAPQNPEINDQFEAKGDSDRDTTVFIESANTVSDITAKSEENVVNTTTSTTTEKTILKITENNTSANVTITAYRKTSISEQETNFFLRIYTIMTAPLRTFMSSPKVNSVIRNIGTCMVNGVMEIISHYLPAPLMPLVASAAGMVIPFEPVVMLRDKMPVASYRRALKTAVNTFMGSFDKYKIVDEFDDDPYMAVRFKRRMMNVDNEETTTLSNQENIS